MQVAAGGATRQACQPFRTIEREQPLEEEAFQPPMQIARPGAQGEPQARRAPGEQGHAEEGAHAGWVDALLIVVSEGAQFVGKGGQEEKRLPAFFAGTQQPVDKVQFHDWLAPGDVDAVGQDDGLPFVRMDGDLQQATR
jgi:hypothetical protein